MRLFAADKRDTMMEGGCHVMHEHRAPGRHLLPHEKKALMHIDFNDEDMNLLCEIYGNEDEAYAAAEVIKQAPPEIQILAIQIMDFLLDDHKEVT